MKRALRIAFASLLLVTAYSPASAWLYCYGPVNVVHTDGAGWPYIDWGFGLHAICRLTVDGTNPNTSQTVPARLCEMWYSMALTAQASGKDLWASLDGSTCTSNPGGFILQTIGGLQVRQ